MKTRLFLVIAIFGFAGAALRAAENLQAWPQSGTVQLESGPYRLTFWEKGKWRLSGFAFQGKELFVNSCSSAGTRYEPFPKTPEQLQSVKLTVDGQVPAQVGGTMKGEKLLLERDTIYGDLRLKSCYEVTPEGLTWRIRFKIVTAEKKAKYFWLYTLAWDKTFSDYRYVKNGVTHAGQLTNSQKWFVNDKADALVMYNPTCETMVLTRPLTPIPTEVRHQAIWDELAYHKYYLQLKAPEWTVGHESPEYVLACSARHAKSADWGSLATEMFRQVQSELPPPAAYPKTAQPSASPAQGKAKSILLDFESDSPNHTDEIVYKGKGSYLFPGNGQAAMRRISLPGLAPGASYRIDLAMRKGTCAVSEARRMMFSVGDNPAGKDFRSFFKDGGKEIPGEDKWTAAKGFFTVPQDSQGGFLMLHNPTTVPLLIDDVKVTPVQAGSAEARVAAGEQKVIRPVPPITDEEAAKEDWLANRRGVEALDDDFILPPFSPIRYQSGVASVWGRDYSFDSYGLLRQVKILDGDFLAGAMGFSATVNGEKVRFRPETQVVLRQKKGVVELYSRATSPNMDIEVRTTVEYDGMLKVDFTFVPRGTVEVEDFRYSIPYPEKYAQFIHYTGAREGGLSLNVPRCSNTRRLPKGEGVVWSAPFKILVWLGGYDRGLLWFCESEQHWSPHERQERQAGLTVSRSQGLVKLEVNPIAAPRLFSKATTYTFGLMATPVRPRPAGWRTLDMNYDYRADVAERQTGADTPVIYSSGSYDFTPPETRNPMAVSFYPRLYDLKAYRQRVESAHARNRLFGLYIDPILFNLGIYKDMSQYKSVGWDPTTDNADSKDARIDAPFLWQSPETRRFFAEWRKEPLATAPYSKNYGERQYQVGLGSRYADFFCYLLEKHADLGCDGVANLDEWGPVPDQNPRHDMGYYDRDGQRHPEYDWFARRSLLKRMCAVFYRKHGRIPLMRVHLAATLVAPIASFCESVVTGENLNSAYFRRSSLMDKYTENGQEMLDSLDHGGKDFLHYASSPDRWAIEYGGQAFGWAVCVMSNLTKSPGFDPTYAASDEASRDYLAMCLAHDNLLWPVFCKPDSAYRLMKIKQDFRIGDPEVVFHPYWGDSHPAAVDGTECYAVCWQNRDRFLVAVTNLSLKDQNLTVTLDKRHFPKGKILDAESRQAVELQNHAFQVSIPRRNYRVYLAE
ncbi:MAG: hypothetical protein IJJ33_12150 [Victivallales bacterium]|nr:hypothetical protein [Victivallales bacterium]